MIAALQQGVYRHCPLVMQQVKKIDGRMHDCHLFCQYWLVTCIKILLGHDKKKQKTSLFSGFQTNLN